MLGRAFFRKVGPLTHRLLLLSKPKEPAINQSIISVSQASTTYLRIIYNPRFYSKQTSTDELLTVDYNYVKNASKDILIIDVREPDEIKEHGKIPNSINIPLGTVATALSASEKEFQQTFNINKPDENTEIIFYCMIGKRSGMAQQNALNLGYKNVKNYLGSWTDWATKSK